VTRYQLEQQFNRAAEGRRRHDEGHSTTLPGGPYGLLIYD
jgi:hypothetical protein